jgi:Ca-activated chloride channel homolog
MLVATITSVSVMSDDELARLFRSPVPSCAVMTGPLHVSNDWSVGPTNDTQVGFPLTAMDIDVTAIGITASIELMQQFVNRSSMPIEATYIFPMPDRMAVRRFRMECNGRVIEGTIDERGAARQQYDQAIASGQRAAIAEEERSGVFTMRVGNIMPGESPIVRLSLIGPLAVDDGEVTLQFPLLVAPRYTSGTTLGGPQAGDGLARDTDAVPDASRVAPPVRIAGLHEAVRLSARVAIVGAVSSVSATLPMLVAPNDGALRLDLSAGQQLNRDLIVRWSIATSTLTSTVTCVDDSDGEAGTFSLLLVPPSSTTALQRPRDVVFVIDRSGSMQGWQLVAARRAVARMVDSLTSSDRFSVMAFDTEIEMPLFDKRSSIANASESAGLVVASDRNRFVAVEFLAKVDARGGTEMEQPLAKAASMLAHSPVERERIIVFATDGQVTGEDHILARLSPMLAGTRVFTIGIDQAVNAAFLRRLASHGNGLFELVESEDRLDDVMATMHRRIGNPVLSNLTIDGDGLAIDPRSFAPARLPDVFVGAPTLITGRYRGKAPAHAGLKVRGQQGSTNFDERMGQRPEAQNFLERFSLSSVWARMRLRDLEDLYITRPKSVVPETLEAQMVEISKRFGVLCRFTAFVAVDRTEVANRSGHQQRIVQGVAPKADQRGDHASRAYPASPSMMRARTMQESSAPAMPMSSSMSYAPPPSGFAAMPQGGPPNMSMPSPKASISSPSPRQESMDPMAPQTKSAGGGIVGTFRRSNPQMDANHRGELQALHNALAHALANADIAAMRVVAARLRIWALEADRNRLPIDGLVLQFSHAVASAFEVGLSAPTPPWHHFADLLQQLQSLIDKDGLTPTGGLTANPPAPTEPATAATKPSRLAFWKRGQR